MLLLIRMSVEELERKGRDFLYDEAEMLEEYRLQDWLALLDDAVDYQVPVRTSRLREEGTGFSTSSFLFKETLGTLTTRIRKLESAYAWAVNPPPRLRYLVSNIRVKNYDNPYLHIHSSLAVFYHHEDNPQPLVITGKRKDVLRLTDERAKLVKRWVLLDTTVVPLPSLSIFL